jgi:hypothetical protein
MNLSEPKNIRRSKASFRKSKSSISIYSDEETNNFTSNKLRSTMCIGQDDATDLFSDAFS